MAELMTRKKMLSSYNPRYMFNRGIIANTGLLPDGVSLLQDVYPLQIIDTKKTITESVKGGAPATKVVGIFQEADKQNANGRIYSKAVLKEAIDNLSDDLKARCVWGELEHPSSPKISLTRVSHLVTNLWMEGSKVIGEAEVIDELPNGNQLRVLLKHGAVGISSRGIGDVEVRERNGAEVYYVCEGYRLVTFDAVAEPSVHGAMLTIAEGKLKPLQKMPVVKKQVKKPLKESLVSKDTYINMLIEAFDIMIDETFQTERGETFDLSDEAIAALRNAKDARQADEAFNEYAPHVPRKDRADIWLKV